MNRNGAQSEKALSISELRARIAALPRVSLAHLPTPLEHCRNLSRTLAGPQIYVKRDDLTGLAFGGNKTRQLEFIFAEVLESGADCVVAGAYTQSNWCRQITAAARKFGLDVHLVLAEGEKGVRLQGNLMLDRLMGADVTVVPEDDEGLQPLLEAKAESLGGSGRHPYLISSFALETQSLAAVGYVESGVEIVEQLQARELVPSRIYIAGSEMSPAGLAVAVRALGLDTRVVGISPVRYRNKPDRGSDIAGIANVTARRLGLTLEFVPSDIHNEDAYVGLRYGVVSPESREALHLLARTEGIILDPVYTSKGMAGLIDHIRKGLVAHSDTVVFVHTGGTPALFSYVEDIDVAPGEDI